MTPYIDKVETGSILAVNESLDKDPNEDTHTFSFVLWTIAL